MNSQCLGVALKAVSHRFSYRPDVSISTVCFTDIAID
jgi:hypothetical protein